MAAYVWEGKTNRGFQEAISDYIEQLAPRLGINEKALCDIQVAVCEAATNCQEHAYGGKNGKVRIEVEKKNDKVVVRVLDWGDSVEVEKVPTPNITTDLDELDLEGLGVMMMRKAMDKVEFSTLPSGENSVEMHKRL
jgi:sigma-B regulation protein RsbU (phosphoserine phosphatase)